MIAASGARPRWATTPYATIAMGLLGVLALAGCAPALTPRQALTYDAYYACRAAGHGDGVLERVALDGGALVVGPEGLVQPLVACINVYVRDGRLLPDDACLGACTR